MTLVVAGIVLLLFESLLPSNLARRSLLMAVIAIAGTVAAFLSLWKTPVGQEGLGGLIWSDGFALFFRIVLLTVLVMVVLSSEEYVSRLRIPAGEYYAMLAFATCGAMFMVISGDLISFYIGLELMSISSYVLAGMLRGDDRSGEASLKYFLNGAMASGIFLFGVSLFFGLSGTTNLREMGATLSFGESGLLGIAALVMVVAGLGFKLAAFPFYLWAPDTYEGSPTPVSAWLSVASKGAAVAGFLRILFIALEPMKGDWMELLAVVAFLTMTVGNAVALHQKNVKRMLAYSSIAQAGYILVGLAAGSSLGFAAAMFYVLAYAFMNVGAFAILVAMQNQDEGVTLDDLSGLARREPVLAFLMFLFMLSLLGIPPLAGFWAKLYIFRAAVDAGLAWLAVAMALNTAVSVAYYYGVVRTIYVADTPPETAGRPVPAGIPMQVGLALAAAGVLVLGLLPEAFFNWAIQVALLH